MMRKRTVGMAASFLLAAPVAGAAQTPSGAPSAPPPAIVVIGASYIAKQLCSCVFVAGRSEASCRAEFKPQIDAFAVTVGAAKVTANLGPETAEADFDRAYGCALVR